MFEADERRISAATFFCKFVFPFLWIGAITAGAIGAAFFEGKNGRPPSPIIGCVIGLVGLASGLSYFVPYHFPLKQVWLGEHGLRISNFHQSVAIPYGEIAEVVQRTEINLRYVVVTLDVDTPFGRRFTFVPRNPKLSWPFSRGEDDDVVELRSWVQAARMKGTAKASPGFDPRSSLSIMADDELDGFY